MRHKVAPATYLPDLVDSTAHHARPCLACPSGLACMVEENLAVGCILESAHKPTSFRANERVNKLVALFPKLANTLQITLITSDDIIAGNRKCKQCCQAQVLFWYLNFCLSSGSSRSRPKHTHTDRHTYISTHKQGLTSKTWRKSSRTLSRTGISVKKNKKKEKKSSSDIPARTKTFLKIPQDGQYPEKPRREKATDEEKKQQ